MHVSQTARSYTALAVGLCAISLSAMFVRWADAPGTVTAFYRMAIASLLLLPMFVRQVSSKPIVRRNWLMFGLLGGLFTALDQGIMSTALGYTRIANATLLNNLAPLWVALFTWLFWKHRLGSSFWLGLVLALGGMSLVVGTDVLQHPQVGFGDLLALASSFAYAGYFLTGQSGRKRLETLTYLWIMTFTSALLLMLFNFLRGNSFVGYSSTTYLSFLGAAVISQTIGHFSLSYALGTLPAAIVAPTAIAQPVLSALLAMPLAGELLTTSQCLGGAVVLAGIYLVNRNKSTDILTSSPAAVSPTSGKN